MPHPNETGVGRRGLTTLVNFRFGPARRPPLNGLVPGLGAANTPVDEGRRVGRAAFGLRGCNEAGVVL